MKSNLAIALVVSAVQAQAESDATDSTNLVYRHGSAAHDYYVRQGYAQDPYYTDYYQYHPTFGDANAAKEKPSEAKPKATAVHEKMASPAPKKEESQP